MALSKVHENCEAVFYDLETTGLDTDTCAITQIAAVFRKQSFQTYVTPTEEISPSASRVTGLVFDGTNLLYKNKKMDHVSPEKALRDFIIFLSSVEGGVILVAHNNRNFDANVLHNQLKKYGLWGKFCRVVKGFADTLPFYRNTYPDLRNHRQETIVESLLGETYDAHNAIQDTKNLQKLVISGDHLNLLLADSECVFNTSDVE